MRDRYYVVLNPRAGAVMAMGITGEALKRRFAEVGLAATIDDNAEAPLGARIATAIASGSEVIVAAGGDGTITALANALVDTDKALAILPLGTVNLLARDLGIPLDIDLALAAMSAMQPRRIDVGEVNGRIFLHKVVIGLLPGLAAGREQLRGKGGLGAKIAFLGFFLRRLSRTRRLALAIEPLSSGGRVERVAAVAVANNAYDEGFGRFFSRQQLDGGFLTLYLLKRSGLGDILRLSAKMILGRWRHDHALVIISARAASIRSRKAKLKVMLDGEVESMTGTLRFRIRPRALSVLVPLVTDESSADQSERALPQGI